MKLEHLRTLAAIVDARTFDAAAATLHLTPSAVSQRVKALEAEVGAVLLTRTVPCVPTAAGEVLVRLGRQVALLEDEAGALLGLGGGRVDVPVAITQDSLATWFMPVLATAASWEDMALRLVPDDQERTAGWLRSGTVLAAVTADASPVAGCRTETLGSMRYLPCAQRTLLERWGDGAGRLDLRRAPMVRFNGDDQLQHQVLAREGVGSSGPETWVPSTEAFSAAIGLGLGWGVIIDSMLPELQRQYPDLVELGLAPWDTPLYWQRWKVDSPALDRLTEAVRVAARQLFPA